MLGKIKKKVFMFKSYLCKFIGFLVPKTQKEIWKLASEVVYVLQNEDVKKIESFSISFLHSSFYLKFMNGAELNIPFQAKIETNSDKEKE